MSKIIFPGNISLVSSGRKKTGTFTVFVFIKQMSCISLTGKGPSLTLLANPLFLHHSTPMFTFNASANCGRPEV